MLRNSQLLNAALAETLTKLGHGQSIVIADPGLPCPRLVPVIDLALVPGVPGIVQVTGAILAEGVFESVTVAAELRGCARLGELLQILAPLSINEISHEEFKSQLDTAQAIVRTGECTPYANVILTAGVSF